MDTTNPADTSRMERATAVGTETDRLLAHALESSRSITDLDSRSISLMLICGALFVVSMLGSVKEIELLGVKLESVEWLYVVLPLGVTVLYHALHLLIRWWSEQQLWHLQAEPSIVASRDKIVQLVYDHDILKSQWLASVQRFQSYVGSDEWTTPEVFEHAHPQWECDPPEVVRAALEARFQDEWKKLHEQGYFQHMSEEHWTASMRCAIESEVEIAALRQPGADQQNDKESTVVQRRIEAQRQHSMHILDAPPSLELDQNRRVIAYCKHAARRINLLLHICKIRLWSVVIVPLSLAAISLTVMLVQICLRYGAPWMH